MSSVRFTTLHCRIKKNAVITAAYIGRRKLLNKKTGEESDFRKKAEEVSYSEILAPIGSPPWVYTPESLWNNVEHSEIRVDAQKAREIIIALPIKLSTEQQINLIKKYVIKNFVQLGMIADVNIHNLKTNPHAHVLLTTRNLLENGYFGNKNREWNKRDLLKKWRKEWEKECNDFLASCNISDRICCESYETKKILKIPTLHIGNNSNKEIKKEINIIINKINKLIEHQNRNLFFKNNDISYSLEELISELKNKLSKKDIENYKKTKNMMETLYKIFSTQQHKNESVAPTDPQEEIAYIEFPTSLLT